MKKKILLSSLAIIGFAGLAGISFASAHGGIGWLGGSFDPEKFAEGQQTMFARQAEMLGIEVNKVKDYWAEGKSFKEIADAENITTEQLQEKMKQAREQDMKTQLQVLVEKGIITQEQADARLKVMEEKIANGGWKHGMMGGFMMGGRHGRY
jgi:predicted DNA-binding protein YlxM (UPF0122 family)